VKFLISLPFIIPGHEQLADPDALVTLAHAVEESGLHACGVSDHPFPQMDSGPAHHAWDPFSILSFLAAETKRVKLVTLAVVLPYRNPFIVASAARTLDRVSSGRAVIAVGAGYLQAEFDALGASYERRNELCDEALVAIKAAWTGEPVEASGPGWIARGNTMLPTPLSSPHPPIWVGGNSGVAARRAARYGDGWAPVLKDAAQAEKTASAPAESLEALGTRIERLRELERQEEREAPLDICLLRGGVGWPSPDPTPEIREEVARLESLGVTWISFHPTGDTVAEQVERIQAWGAAFGHSAHDS